MSNGNGIRNFNLEICKLDVQSVVAQMDERFDYGQRKRSGRINDGLAWPIPSPTGLSGSLTAESGSRVTSLYDAERGRQVYV